MKVKNEKVKVFYLEYKEDEIWQQLVAKLPWGRNVLLLEKIKDKNIRMIYVNTTYKLKDYLPTEEEINLHINLN